MATQGSNRASSVTAWTVLRRENWNDHDDLVGLIRSALEELDDVDDIVVYDYIDAEAITAVFGHEGSGRGAHGLRFNCEQYEVRLEKDGTVSARPRTDRV